MKVSYFQNWDNIPKYPKNKNSNFFATLIGILLWLFFILIFIFFAFVNLLLSNIELFLLLITGKKKHVPYWISIILAIFFFPLSIFFTLAMEFYKIIKS